LPPGAREPAGHPPRIRSFPFSFQKTATDCAPAPPAQLLEADINLMTQDLNVLIEEVLVRDRHQP
jgi:hypothetical protein